MKYGRYAMTRQIFSSRGKRTKRYYYRLESYLFEGSQGNDLVGYSKEQVINDILDKYERHMMYLHINRISPGKRPLFPDREISGLSQLRKESMMSESLNAFALFFSLLNPFLMSIYMLGIIRNSDAKVFNMALIQGSLISFIVFIIFAKTGEAFFNEVLHVRFESFQIFWRYYFSGDWLSLCL